MEFISPQGSLIIMMQVIVTKCLFEPECKEANQHNSLKFGPSIVSGDWLDISHCFSKEPLKSIFLVIAL